MSAHAFIQALRPHYDDAARYCRMLCATWHPDDAEDVFQQALLQALKHFDDLRDPEKFRPWLFRIVLNAFRASKRRRFWQRFLPLDQPSEVAPLPAIYHRPARSEARLVLQAALATLSAKERAAILLFEVAGFSLAEVQAIQEDRSLSAVKSRLSRARAKLRAYLDEKETVTSHKKRLRQTTWKMKRSGWWKTSTPTDASTDEALDRLWDAARDDNYADTRPAVEGWIREVYASRLSISTDADRAHTTLILPVLGPGDEDIRRWQRRLDAMGEVVSTRVYPFKETVRRPAYAAALRILRIDVGGERLSEAEVQRRIEAQLRSYGMPEPDVTFWRQPDGRQAIEVVPDSNETHEHP